jgi:GNAT superfamily N-acetyltransferase
MKTRIEVSSPVDLSARVRQAASLFDMPLEEKSHRVWSHDLPLDEREWNVGLVMGPSGAGKSMMANHLWPEHVITGYEWSPLRSLLDDFPSGMGIKDITGLLSSVGFGSPPAWVRPYGTLSSGEAFRATIARALAEADGDLVVIDEYSSVVDRQVAKVASHTVQKAVRAQGSQFIAVSCHYDIEEWLQPDWTYDVAASEFTWRSVQRHPPVVLEIRECPRALWQALFAQHHYLSASLHQASKCFAGYVDGRPVAFTAFLNFPHPGTKNIRMGHRLVVLPDWQGLGIARRMDDWLGHWLYGQGLRFRSVVAHPAMIHYHLSSPRWRETRPPAVRHLGTGMKETGLRGGMRERQLKTRTLGTRSFEFVPSVQGMASYGEEVA